MRPGLPTTKKLRVRRAIDPMGAEKVNANAARYWKIVCSVTNLSSVCGLRKFASIGFRVEQSSDWLIVAILVIWNLGVNGLFT